MSQKFSHEQCEVIFQAALKAGLEAGNKHNPTPMIVEQHSNVMDDNSPVTQRWNVSSGVCGFAWVIIRPGNSSFANYLKKFQDCRVDSYYGGVNYWVSEFGQSMEKKEAFARAFTKVLTNLGIKAYSYSRID